MFGDLPIDPLSVPLLAFSRLELFGIRQRANPTIDFGDQFAFDYAVCTSLSLAPT